MGVQIKKHIIGTKAQCHNPAVQFRPVHWLRRWSCHRRRPPCIIFILHFPDVYKRQVEKYIHGLFPIWGIRFISIVDNADTANKGNKKSRQINGLVNEWYLEDMSENIKSVLTDRRKNGHHIGAFALYGYKKDPDVKGHLIIDEEAAEVVREVFTLFSQGYGKTAIARCV